MTEEVAGQTDIFAELGEPVPVPPFTVFTCVWTENRCGWCGGQGFVGGGACRNPENEDESIFYRYCQKCLDKWGHPKVRALVLVFDRTETPRPAVLGGPS